MKYCASSIFVFVFCMLLFGNVMGQSNGFAIVHKGNTINCYASNKAVTYGGFTQANKGWPYKFVGIRAKVWVKLTGPTSGVEIHDARTGTESADTTESDTKFNCSWGNYESPSKHAAEEFFIAEVTSEWLPSFTLESLTSELNGKTCELKEPPQPPCRPVPKTEEEDEGCNHSPIVIDLSSDGFRFSGPEGAVHYDLYNSGIPVHIQWVERNGDDAFLVRDANDNGRVDHGGELFGNGTDLLTTGEKASNGFVALAEFDLEAFGGNNDGVITKEDEVWYELHLWLDRNADGVSQPSELTYIMETEIRELGIIPRETDLVDEHMNWLRFWAEAGTSKSRLTMVDVFFNSVSGTSSSQSAD
ncbi:MAG: hypothetical protein QNK37_02735 [Acidobacteriota bacterium]|nr:hypothetical protein [Acidobacteriota bacterium]